MHTSTRERAAVEQAELRAPTIRRVMDPAQSIDPEFLTRPLSATQESHVKRAMERLAAASEALEDALQHMQGLPVDRRALVHANSAIGVQEAHGYLYALDCLLLQSRSLRRRGVTV